MTRHLSYLSAHRLVSIGLLIAFWSGGCCLCFAQEKASEKASEKPSEKPSNEDGDQQLPRVLILGDSISIGYTPHVKKQLQGKAEVFRPTFAKNGRPENCAGTLKGEKEIDRWLKADGGKWDVIHFNFGLHDLKHVDGESGKNSNNPKDPRQSEPDEYEARLRSIVKKLKATKAKLIYATTTPVPEGGVKPYRDPGDSQKYNQIARKIMNENGIEVNDLYDFANKRLKEIQIPVNVHFTKKGSEALGKQVSKVIIKQLEK